MSSYYTKPPSFARRKNISEQQANEYDALAERIEQEEGLRPGLLRALISQESGYDPQAESKKGARGLGQLMPATAKRFGVLDVNDPEQNLRGSAKYLKFLDERFKGDLDKVYAGYNAGEGAVDKYGGIPPYKETQNYVPRVRSNYARLTGEQYNAPVKAQPVSYKSGNSANSAVAAEDDPFQLLASAGFTPDPQDDPFKLLEGAGFAPSSSPSQPPTKAAPSSPTAYGRPGQPRVDQGVKIFNPSETRSDVLAKQFGFSKPEIERYKKDFGREPFEGYKDVVGLASQVQAVDPGRYNGLMTFLKNVRGDESGSTSGLADPNSLVENLVTAKTPANQRAIGGTVGSGVNALLFGNLNRVQKPFTGADIPEPERLRTKVVQGVDGKPVEVYDDEANPTGNPLREVISPENVAGFGANLLGFTGLSQGIAKGGAAIAGRAAQGSRLARAGQVLAGTAENVGRLENAGKTAALFGSAALLTDPDPTNQMTPAQQLAKRLEAGVASGATGWVAGVLGGINPSIAKEAITFTVPFAVKTALEGYLAGLSYEEIEKAVATEALTNAVLPVVLRGGEVVSSGKQGLLKAANKLGVGEKFARDVRQQARETIGELQELQNNTMGEVDPNANPNLVMDAGAPPPSVELTPEQKAQQIGDLMAEQAAILSKGLEKITPEEGDRLEQIKAELRGLREPRTKPAPPTLAEPPIAKRPTEDAPAYELTSDELISEIDALQNKLRTIPNTSVDAIQARKRIKALENEQKQRLAGDEGITKPDEIERAIELDRRITETKRLFEDEAANSELLTSEADLTVSNERLKTLADELAIMEAERAKLPKLTEQALKTSTPVKPIEIKQTRSTDVKKEPKRAIFDEFGNTRSYGEVEREKLKALTTELKLKPEQAQRIIELQEQFTTDPITGFEISQYIQPTLEAALLNNKPTSYAKVEVVNLGGKNAAYGNPLASNDVIGKFGDILKAELEPLNDLGGKVNLFRGEGGQLEVIASNVEPALLEKVLGRYKDRVNKEVVIPAGLDKIASPKLKSAKEKQATEPNEYIKTLGKSGGGVQFVVEGVNDRASAKEIRESAAQKLENSYTERAKSVREDQFVSDIRPVRPTRDTEPSFLTREVKPVELGEAFSTPQDLLKAEIKQLAKGLTAEQRKDLSKTVQDLLLKDELLGKFGFLGASEREYTARRAAEYTDATNEPSFYAEFDFRNVGGLNKFLGDKQADNVLKEFGKAISENLQKLGNSKVSVSLFRHGGDEVSAIIVGADRARIQTAIDKAVVEVDKYVKATKLEGYDLSTLPHPKNSLPGTGVIGAIAKFEPLNQNAPKTMQERVEEVLGAAGSAIEDIKSDLKKQYESTKKEVIDNGQRGETGKTRVSTSSGQPGSITSSTEGKDKQPRGKGTSSRGSTSKGSSSTTPGKNTQDTDGSANKSASSDGSEGSRGSEPTKLNEPTTDTATSPSSDTDTTEATSDTNVVESTTEATTEVEVEQDATVKEPSKEVSKAEKPPKDDDNTDDGGSTPPPAPPDNTPKTPSSPAKDTPPTKTTPNVEAKAEAISKGLNQPIETVKKVLRNLEEKRNQPEVVDQTKTVENKEVTPETEVKKTEVVDQVKPVKKPVESETETKAETKVTSPDTNVKEERPGTRKLIETLVDKLSKKTSVPTPSALYELSNEAFNGKAPGDYPFQDAYNALEGAVNKRLLDVLPSLEGKTIQEKLSAMREIMELLPTQYDRSGEKVKQQAFSTPPALALIANEAAKITKGDVVLEPSAGTGGLAIFAKAKGADVYVNEIDTKRQDVMRAIGLDKVTGVDALLINDLLPENIQPDVVVMNPPFSSNIKAGKDLLTGANHVEAALNRLKDNGRLVAIVGGGMRTDSSTYKPFFDKVLAKYKLLANLGIEGKEYKKYGTDFDNRLLVFDKTGSTDINSVLTGENLTLDQALEKVSQLNDRSPSLQTLDDATGDNVGDKRTAPDVSGQRSGSNGVTGRELPNKPTKQRETKPVQQDIEAIPTGKPDVQDATEPVTTKPDEQRNEVPDSPTDDKVSDRTNPVKEEDIETESFAAYRAPFSSKSPHKEPIVESRSMAGVEPPKIEPEKLGLAPEITNAWEKGELSDLQIESISRAEVRHRVKLPDGKTAGFFIGDGTGVGKGRQIAGVVLNNWKQGRKRILWISATGNLNKQAIGDLQAIGGGDIPLKVLNDFNIKDKIGAKMSDGVMFAGYGILTGGAKDNSGRTRLQQIGEWLPPDSVIVFDEVHKAANFIQVEAGRNSKQPSQTATAVDMLQNSRPNARVLYVSATGASETRHLGIMSRLGLWGKGTAFPDGFNQFNSVISSGGLGAMEQVARDMKALGMYVARQISYAGTEYKGATHELTSNQRKQYDFASEAWQTVLDNVNEALDITKADATAKLNAMSQFWAGHQRFFNTLITAFKIPTAIKEIRESLDRGESVVMSLINTNDAQANREVNRILQENGTLDDIDFSPKDILLQYLNNAFPTRLFEKVADEKGNVTSKPVMLDENRQAESVEAKKLKEKITKQIDRIFNGDLSLPDNPTDAILRAFGANEVAEISGRKVQYLPDPVTGEIKQLKKYDNLTEQAAFQSGKKRIAVLSGAGSTGFDFHSSKKNPPEGQKRRNMLTFQLGFNAAQQMQTFGRIHRTNQAYPPIYTTLTTDIGGEKRFSSTIAKRLADLGALTRGERSASGNEELAQYNFESPEGRAAVGLTYDALIADRKNFPDGSSIIKKLRVKKLDKNNNAEIPLEKKTDIKNFLNRVLGLPIAEQNRVFDYFANKFQEVVATAKEQGTFDDGTSTIKAKKITVADEVPVYKDPGTGAETKLYKLEAEMVTKKTTAVDIESFAKWYEQDDNGANGYYKNSKGEPIYVIEASPITDENGNTQRRFRVYKPDRDIGDVRIVKSLDSYLKTEVAEARELWKQYYDNAPPTYIDDIRVLSGALLPIYNKIQAGLSDSKSKIQNVSLNDSVTGSRIVGLKIPSEAVRSVLDRLGVGQDTNYNTPENVFTRVYDFGEKIKLEDGFELKAVRRANSLNIELSRPSYTSETVQRLENLGFQQEIVGSKKRFYMPTERQAAIKVLTGLLKDNPIIPEKRNVLKEIVTKTIELPKRALTDKQKINAFQPATDIQYTTTPYTGNRLSEGRYAGSRKLIVDLEAVKPYLDNGLIDTLKESEPNLSEYNKVAPSRAATLFEKAEKGDPVSVLGFLVDKDGSKVYLSKDNAYIDGDNFKFITEQLQADKITLDYENNAYFYKNDQAIAVTKYVYDRDINFSQLQKKAETFNEKSSLIADYDPNIMPEQVDPNADKQQKSKKLYQETIVPEKLVAPGSVSRQKLWNVIATHGLVDADGKKLPFKQAIETTDKVLLLMDTFARSTGKDLDTWYKDTFANAISEKMVKANGKVNVKAATEFLKNGQTVLRLFEGADASTLVHESFHIFRQQLTPTENTTLNKWLTDNGFKDVDLNNKTKVYTNAEEFIARAGENYLRSGKLPEQAPSMLKQVFNSFGGWIKGIYDRLQSGGKIKIAFGKGIKKFFDEVQFDEQARGVFEQRFIRGGETATTKLLTDATSPSFARDKVTKTIPDGGQSLGYTLQGNQQLQELTRTVNAISGTTDSNSPRSTPPEANKYSLSGSGEVKTRSIPESARPYLDPELAKTVKPQEYNTLTNDETAKAARSLIERRPDEALLLATGSKSGALENEIAIQMLSKAQADGDFTQARQILDALAQRSTEAGRAIQILSRIANASPEGTLAYAKRIIERESPDVSAGVRKQADFITDRLKELVGALEATEPVKEAIVRFYQKGILPSKLADKVINAVTKQPSKQGQMQAIEDTVKKHYGIATLDNATAQRIYDLSKQAQQATGYEQEQIHARIAKVIGAQIPATTGKKLNFWLRVSDLFNPSGALFNTASDLAYGSPLGIETGVDLLASGIDKVGKGLGIFKQRSLVAPNVGEQLKDFKTNLGRVKEEIKEGIDTQEVLEKKMGVPSTVPVRGQAASFLDKAVRFGYGWTQSASFRTAKAESIRNQMKVAELNGQKLNAPTTEMVERAELEAAQRAMIDDNFVSKALLGVKKSLNKLSTGGKSEEFGLGSVVLTYTQVPGSLLKRGIEFSPVGFGKVGYEILKAAKTGDFDQRKFVKDLSRAIIGTGLGLGLAALLHRVGVLQQPSEGDDEGRLRRLQSDEGLSSYRLNIDSFLRYAASGFKDAEVAKAKQGDRLVNYEFMQPLGFILNFGANMDRTAREAREAAKAGKPINETWASIKALTSAGIQTLNDAPLIRSLIEASQLTEGDSGEYGKALAKKLVTRPVPALVRQARNYLDNTKRITDEPGDLEQTLINSVKDALPSYSKSLPAQKTAFGDDKPRVVGGNGFMDSFVLGGKVNNYQSNEETTTAKKIFEGREPQQGRDYHIPSSPRELKVNGQQYTLTAKDKSNYQEYLGKQAKQIYQFANKSNVFNKLTPEQQGKVLAKYIDIAKEKAKIEVLGDKPPQKEKILKRTILPSKEVFDHNLTVMSKMESLLEQVKTDKKFASLYDQLTPEQQQHAERQITNIFNKVKIDENSDKLEIVQKAEANEAKLLLPILKPELQVPVILQMAKFYRKENN